jgi:hypothetical protein
MKVLRPRGPTQKVVHMEPNMNKSLQKARKEQAKNQPRNSKGRFKEDTELRQTVTEALKKVKVIKVWHP